MNVTVQIERRGNGPTRPEWVCPSCHAGARHAEVRANLMVCPSCGHHLRIGAHERIRQLTDEGTFRELWGRVATRDPLGFVDLEAYPERVREAQAKTGLQEAIVTGTASIDTTPCVLAVMDFGFLGGSMGSVVGEKLWRSAELASGDDLPLVAVCTSGGARMQEGILSLMQMAKTSCAVDLINEATSPFVTILADPCTGGVVASFATLADICIAEPGARLYFTGPRVIQQTTHEELPPGFSTAERNLELGHLDAVVPRADLRVRVGNYLRLLGGVRNLTEEKTKSEQDARVGWLKQRLSELVRLSRMPGVHLSEEIEKLQTRLEKLRREDRRHDTWVTVEIARHKERPRTRDYIGHLIDGFEELKGDRLRADDPAIVGGLGWFHGRAVLVVGHQKGRTLDEQTQHNFGMAKPEGYRKAQRLFRLAERHGLPVFTFVDTPGAYPGVAAEEGGQARAIAESMLCMARLSVPVIATIIGEGGSGGALALAVADRVLMLENATYSVITPEGCAAILWRDADFAPQAAEALRPTASHLLELLAVEKVVEEPRGGAHHNPELAAQRLGEAIAETLAELDEIPARERRRQRRERFRRLGHWDDPEQPSTGPSPFGGHAAPAE